MAAGFGALRLFLFFSVIGSPYVRHNPRCGLYVRRNIFIPAVRLVGTGARCRCYTLLFLFLHDRVDRPVTGDIPVLNSPLESVAGAEGIGAIALRSEEVRRDEGG